MIYDIIPGYKLLMYLSNKRNYKGVAKIGYGVKIGKCSVLEGSNEILTNTRFNGKIGYGSYIAQDCDVNARIGRFTSIAAKVKVLTGMHPYKAPYATTSPYFYSNRNGSPFTFANDNLFEEMRYADTENKIPVVIGNDCWIGYDSVLIGGVTIGDGTVVLSRSVVTKNTPPYSIVGGVPAKIIGYRFEEVDINFLNRIRWWDKPTEWLKANWRLLSDIELLKDYFKDK